MKYFEISIEADGRRFLVDHVQPPSADAANAVMFVNEAHRDLLPGLSGARDCVIFVPEGAAVPERLRAESLVVPSGNPRLAYAKFFAQRHIRTCPVDRDLEERDFSLFSKDVRIGARSVVMPGVKMIGEISVGEDCYIGCNTTIVGRVRIGNDVVIAEDCVIGTESFAYERDGDGTIVRVPQFGGVVIGDHVSLLVGSVVSRGAMVDTVVEEGAKIGMWSLISHNDRIGAHSMIMHSQIAGSTTVEPYAECCYSDIRDNITVGEGAKTAFGAVVLKSVEANTMVAGNPARPFGRNGR